MPVSIGTFFKRWSHDFTQNQSCFTTSQRMAILAARIYENDPSVAVEVESKAHTELARLIRAKREAMAKQSTRDDVSVRPFALPAAAPAAAPQLKKVERRRASMRKSITHMDVLKLVQPNTDDKKPAAVNSAVASKYVAPKPNVRVSIEYDSHVPTRSRRYNPIHAVTWGLGSLKQLGCQAIDNISSYCSRKWAGSSYVKPLEPVPSNYLTRAVKFIFVGLPFGLAEGLWHLCIGQTLGRLIDFVIDKNSPKNKQTITVDVNKPQTEYRSDNFRKAAEPILLAPRVKPAPVKKAEAKLIPLLSTGLAKGLLVSIQSARATPHSLATPAATTASTTPHSTASAPAATPSPRGVAAIELMPLPPPVAAPLPQFTRRRT